jgi:hypothetical protein
LPPSGICAGAIRATKRPSAQMAATPRASSQVPAGARSQNVFQNICYASLVHDANGSKSAAIKRDLSSEVPLTLAEWITHAFGGAMSPTAGHGKYFMVPANFSGDCNTIAKRAPERTA